MDERGGPRPALGWHRSIAPGGHADLIVVDRDPLTCPVEDLPGTEVLATALGGELVHGDWP